MAKRSPVARDFDRMIRSVTATPQRPRGPRATKGRLEKGEQLAIIDLMVALGAKPYVLGTKRKKTDHQGTMQTAGIPDLQFFLPEKRPVRLAQLFTRRFVIVEVKREVGGRYSSAQVEYRGLARCAGLDYINGGTLNDVIAWLVAEGYLRADQVPHYRRPSTEGGITAGPDTKQPT